MATKQQQKAPTLKTGQYPIEHLAEAEKALREIFAQHAGYFRQSSMTQRRTVEYGYHFQKLILDDIRTTQPPKILQDIYKKACAALSTQNPEIASSLPKDFNNVIISHYSPGDQLQPHIDVSKRYPRLKTVPMEKRGKKKRSGGKERRPQKRELNNPFYFGENVIGVVIKADQQGGLYLQEMRPKEKPQFDAQRATHIDEDDGTIFLLAGDGRHAPWQHGVSPILEERISITFRDVKFLNKQPACSNSAPVYEAGTAPL